MNCLNCKNYCGIFKMDIDYIKCCYWNEIELRAAINTKAIVCPKGKILVEEKDWIMCKAIDFVFYLI